MRWPGQGCARGAGIAFRAAAGAGRVGGNSDGDFGRGAQRLRGPRCDLRVAEGPPSPRAARHTTLRSRPQRAPNPPVTPAHVRHSMARRRAAAADIIRPAHPRHSACVQSGGSDGCGRPGSGSGPGTPGPSGRGGSGGGVGDPGGAGGSGGTGGSAGSGGSTGSTRSGGPGGDGGSGGGTDVMSGSGGTGTVPMIAASYWCSSSLDRPAIGGWVKERGWVRAAARRRIEATRSVVD
ncbi:hypothetical protein SAMN02787144_105317 [Streptomyces atratus]|uniref:Uncharacterized protein n=1 Tax=Streptomyces atratus TaxID=1893 RepID=A0A1K2FAH5_STRAR|nr:hypothetical protein SAMN02787144_105317 [Streptomyces atratus]